MADNASFIQLSESIQNMNLLKDMPEMSEDDRSEIQQYLQDLASRQESKFDAIIEMIKRCDTYINALQAEAEEIQNNINSWKKNKQNLVNIIKFAYEQNLIDNKPTGFKYQGTIKKVKPKLVDNFDCWDADERYEFTLRKTTTITRVRDETILEVKNEDIPDKEYLREQLLANTGLAPVAAQLVPSVSLTYERRKRLCSK